ncbi:hypothetical protein Pst134EB_014144 [Puccinia striiformis f. sp. tritici]|nr:hypothetical protein Pst134EB_014144 [Puccinia striiformis f. sp. tritici]
MSRPSNLPILGTNTPPTTGTGVTVPPEIWAGMQQLFAAFGPSASNSLPSSVATPALNHAQLTSSPALPDHNNLTTPLVQSPPLPNPNDLFLPQLNDPTTPAFPRFEQLPDDVNANSDDGNSNTHTDRCQLYQKMPQLELNCLQWSQTS